MIFCRFTTGNDAHYGIVENHQVFEIEPDPFSKFETIRDPLPVSKVRFLAPVLPSKIVAIGVNYREHGKEMNHEIPQEPKIFLKPASAVLDPEEPICYPSISQRVDYEAELAVVIKQRAKNINEKDAEKYIFGYTCFNDVTARDLQQKDGQWSRAKGFDTFAPLGPWIVSDLDVSNLSIESYLNGELKQSANTRELIFKVPFLISFISQVMTLEPGDVIATGTPPGIGPMQPGDEIVVRIEGIGVLRNYVSSPL